MQRDKCIVLESKPGKRKRLAFTICLSAYSLRSLFGGDNKHGVEVVSEMGVEIALVREGLRLQE